MVIGNGLIANAFHHYSDNEKFIFFASGVSNSISEDVNDYRKELDLLESVLSKRKKNQILIYFSSFNVFDPTLHSNSYVIHKRSVENFLSQYKDTTVIRLPIVLAKSNNPTTLVNYFIQSIHNSVNITVYSEAWRYVISLEDTVRMVDHILNLQSNPSPFYNISYPTPIKVEKMLELIEAHFNKRAQQKHYLSKGCFYDVTEISYNFIQKNKIVNAEDYFTEFLIKNH
jgi:UDP-2-acetamido-2,6-beta-L-arabino-hexul-4-ose reductase